MGAVVRAVVLGLVLAGCGTNATVTRRRGDAVEGKLLGRRAGHLWVQRADDRKIAVPDDDVADVTHPGTPAIVAGGGTLVLSLLLFAWAQSEDCSGQYCGGVGTIVAVPAVAGLTTGIGMMLWGLSEYSTSYARAGTAPAPARPPAPTAEPKGGWAPPF
jgi:hypothetical protein